MLIFWCLGSLGLWVSCVRIRCGCLGRGRVYVFEKEDESVDWVQKYEGVWAEEVNVVYYQW
jgi:hypothetical protein